jgi:hypothetical protein
MGRDWKYILYISLAFGAFTLIRLLSPRHHDWTVTYAAVDKNPFGGYALNSLIRTLFPKKTVNHSFKTLYELNDTVPAGSNMFVLAETFSPSKEDTEVMLDHVYKGGTAFISAQYLYGVLADTLKLRTYDTNFKFATVLSSEDSTTLHFVATAFDTTLRYPYKQANVHNYISKFDTTRTTVIAVNEQKVPITIRMKWGEGNILINSTPLIFTNICLLSAQNSDFVSAQLSYLSDAPITWTEYYQRGRREVGTPLRFILMNEPLSWAYYIAIITLVIFMFFEAKRKQRIIPVIPPLSNTTLEFVSTIGDLYFQNGDHKNVAEKKINYFLEQVRSRHNLGRQKIDDDFAVLLAKKSGHPAADTHSLIELIQEIRNKAAISADELIQLNSKLESYYRQE